MRRKLKKRSKVNYPWICTLCDKTHLEEKLHDMFHAEERKRNEERRLLLGELVKCHCGGTPKAIVYILSKPQYGCFECSDCGVRGDKCDNEQKATISWNKKQRILKNKKT